MSVRFPASTAFLKRTADLPPATSPITVCYWARTQVTQGPTAFPSHFAFSNSGNTFGYAVQADTDALTYKLVDNTDAYVATGPTVVNGVWYFFAVVIRGTNDASIFYAAEGVDTPTRVNAATFQLMTAAPVNLYIGQDWASEFFNGDLAHFKIWNAALTDDEIKQELSSAQPVREANVLFYFPLEAAVNAGVETFHGRFLTVNGAPGTNTDPVIAAFPPPPMGAVFRTPAVAAPALAWSPTFPSIVRGTAATAALAMAFASPIAPPANPAPPALSWAPTFADIVPGARYQNHGGPSSGPVAPVTAATVTPLSWKPIYPDIVVGRARAAEGWNTGRVDPPQMAFSADLFESTTWDEMLAADATPILSWLARLPDAPPIASVPRAAEGWNACVRVPAAAALPPLTWLPTYPDSPSGRRCLIEGGSAASPTGLPNFTVPTLGWLGSFPDTAPGRRVQVDGWTVDPPGLPSWPVPTLAWLPTYPVSLTGRLPLAERWTSPPVGTPSWPVPALSWLGSWPDAPYRSPMPLGVPSWVGPIFPVGAAPPAPALSWIPRFPDGIVVRLPGILAPAIQQPPLDLSKFAVPPLSWIGSYPDRAPGVRNLLTGGEYRTDIVVPTPFGWLPAYPDIVPGRGPAREGFALVAPMLPPPPPVLAWAPTYPNQFAPPMPLARGERVWNFLPPVLPPMSWQPSYPDIVVGRKASETGQSVGPLTLPPPLLSTWLPFFPDSAPGRKAALTPYSTGRVDAPAPPPTAPPLSWAPIMPEMFRIALINPASGSTFVYVSPTTAAGIVVTVKSGTGIPSRVRIWRTPSG